MVNFGKAFDASKMTIILVLVLWFGVQLLATFLPILGLLHLLLLPVNAVLFAWAGYKATRNLKQDVVTAGVAGAIAALVTGIVSFILSLLLLPIAMAVTGGSMVLGGTDATSGAVMGAATGLAGFGGAIITAIIHIPSSIILNFILAAIGGYIGQRK